MATKIQMRRGTGAEWASSNPLLMEGEMGVETDTQFWKIGNGSDHWNDLEYYGGSAYEIAVSQGFSGTVNKWLESLVGMHYKGTYSATTAYVVNDVVYSNRSSYICVTNNTGQGINNTTYWKPLVIAPTGDVVGISNSYNNRVAFFNGTSGKEIKDNGINLTGNNTGDETTSTIKTKLGAASASADGYLTSGDFTTFNNKLSGNTAITGGTKTKITYDSKGLVTSGENATTLDIADSTNKRYVTDIQLATLGNTSGTNTGDQSASDFDIKDLADSTDLRILWSNKQDSLTEGVDYLTPSGAASTYEPKKGTDDNYVTDAEKLALHSHTNKTALDAVSGTNTGDETTSTIKTKLGITTLSGSNTGDQDLSGKVDKVTGKGLSTEDYTTTEKSKLAGIASGAEVNVNADWNAVSGDAQILNKPTIPAAQIQSDWNQTNNTLLDYIKNKPTIPTVPTKISDLTDDTSTYPIDKSDSLTGVSTAGNSKYYGTNSGGTAGFYDLPTGGGTEDPATDTTLGLVKTSEFIGLDVNNKLNPNVHIYNWDGKSGTTTPSNIALFQKIYDDYLAGNKIIILAKTDINSYSILTFYSKGSTWFIFNSDIYISSVSDYSSYSYALFKYNQCHVTLSGDTVTAVNTIYDSNNSVGNFLRTNKDYTTPYTPLYDGSPATKKYVDDAVSGSGGGSGDVVGPSSSTDNAVARFDSTTGKLIQNSLVTIDDSGNLAATNISGTNTGDQILPTRNSLGLDTDDTVTFANLSGTNTGDETDSTIKTKLGITTLSGSNTGDETASTIKTKLGITTLSGSNTGDQTLSGLGGVASNTAITGATKTKITYDSKGLVTGGAAATTADIADSTNKRYCTDAQKTVIGNTSNTNTGDETQSTIKTKLGAATASVDGYATSTQITKLNGIEAGAEVNNISDVNATDLTDGGATTLHKHSYNNLDDKPTIPTLPVKCTGAEIDTGTDDAKFVTAKAIRDSKLEAINLTQTEFQTLVDNSELVDGQIYNIIEENTEICTGDWLESNETWTYSSVDDPTGVITISGDKTTKYSLGTRIKFVNGGNTIYGIVTKISYSSPNTVLTFLHEIDPTDSLALYLMANSAITSNYYSKLRYPLGFPTDKNKWKVYKISAGTVSQSNPSDATYYNINSTKLDIPIGDFEVCYSVAVAASRGTAGVINAGTTLSTSTSSESNSRFTYQFDFPNNITQLGYLLMGKCSQVTNTVKTPYYLLSRVTATSINALYNKTILIEATCNYL